MSNIGSYADAMGLKASSLLERATVFTTLVAFQSSDRKEAYRTAAIEGAPSKTVGFSAFQSTATFVPLRRLCLLCVRSDKSRYGVAYWHLSHQLPGASLCERHGTRLRVTGITTASGASRWSYLLPDEVGSMPQRRRAAKFDVELNKLACCTQAGQGRGALGPLPAGFYRAELVRAGLVSRDRQVNAGLARDWIAGHLGGQAGCAGLLQVDPTLSWVDLILRERPGSPFPACKHLIIQAALASTPSPNSPILNHKSKGYSGKEVRELDASKALILDAQIRLRLKAGTRFTLQGELEALGVWHGFRHNRPKYPSIARVIERHRLEMLSMKNRRTSTKSAHHL